MTKEFASGGTIRIELGLTERDFAVLSRILCVFL